MNEHRPTARSLLLALVVCVLTPAAIAQDDAAPAPAPAAVRIEGGRVRGTIEDGVRVYRGIPYAAAPVGGLRWRPPQPVVPWEGVRPCVEFGPSCPQPDGFGKFGGARGEMSEDCLYLNVWTPAVEASARLPVMVWIHGGGFTIGSGSLPFYDGRQLADRGVVVVTINYRLGPLGFFAHPLLSAESDRKVSGNYGILDQIAALRWVRGNIAAFGGDPGRVTIFGESAGAVSVAVLMVTPLSRGLFHGAVAQSGGISGVSESLRTRRGKSPAAEQAGVGLERALGCHEAEDPLAALRNTSWQRLLEVAKPAPVAIGGKGKKYGPIVDGHVLPDDPVLLWASGKQHDVPFIAGSNADDGNVFADRLPIRTRLGYKLGVRAAFGEDAGEVLERMPVRRGESVRIATRRLLTVSSFVSQARFLVRCMEKVESPGRLYHFTRVTPVAARSGQGAAHGFEIPYVFGLGVLPGWLSVEEADHRLSKRMQACWLRFAATGDPNAEGAAVWPEYRTETDLHIEFGDRVIAGTGLFKDECDLFHRLMMKRR